MDAPSKPVFTLMTLMNEPSLAGKSKPETSAKKCMQNEVCKSTSMYTMCKPMRIQVKACRKIPWIAMALQIKTRLWLGGGGSAQRNRLLADALFHLVKPCCLPLQELLVVTEGWAASPKSIRRVFREKALRQARQGRCRLLAWPGLLIGPVIKRTERKQVVEVVRRMAQGLEERAFQLLASTQGGNGLHTSFIERINGTLRERLASLTRRCRHASHSVEMLGFWDVACWLYRHLLVAPSRYSADNGNRT